MDNRSELSNMMRILLFFVLINAVHSKLTWKRLSANNVSNDFPPPRRDSSIGYNRQGKQVIIFGGKAKSANFDDTWIFHFANRSWSKVNPTKDSNGAVIPEKRFSMVFGSINDYFYVSTGEFSGDDTSSRRFFDDILQFDFVTMQWQRLEPQSSLKPEERYGASGGIFDDGNSDNGFYVTHGFAGTRYSNTFRFDLKKNEWQEKFHGSNSYNPSYPHSRCLQSGTMTKPDELVLYGGCLGGGGTGGPCPSKDNWKFDATAVEWTRLEECSTPRMYSAMAMLPPLRNTSVRRAVLYGGAEKSKSVLVTPEYQPDEIAVFNPDTNKWERKKVEGTPPSKRAGHVMTTTDDGIIMFGGNSDDVNLNDVWLLEGTASDADDNLSAGNCGSADFNLIMLHGLFMFLGWGLFLQLGAFIARYFRGRDPWWFKMHKGFQVTGLVFAFAGFICAIVSVPFGHFKFAHGPIGLVIMIIGIGQPINAIIRPHKDKDKSKPTTLRIVWEYFHKNVGRLGLVLALINISLGFFLAVVPVSVWAVWYTLLCVFVLFYLIMEVRMRMAENNAKNVSFPMK